MTQSENPVEDVIRRRHLYDILSTRFHANADSIALDDGDRTWTYAELQDDIDVVAGEFLRRGLQPGDRIAFGAAPTGRFVVTYLAAVSVGCIWMGLNPKYTTRELGYVLGDARPKLVLLHEGVGSEPNDSALDDSAFRNIDALQRSGPECEVLDYDDFRRSIPQGQIRHDELRRRRQVLRPGDPALLIYTSGSTGDPKGALVSAAALARIAMVQSERWALEDPSFVCNLPINHIGCVGDLVTVALYAGARIRFVTGFDPGEMVRLIRDEGITGLFQIPTQLIRIADEPGFDGDAAKTLRLVGWGGAALPIRYIRRFRELGLRMKTVYGSTETVASVTYSPEGATDEQLANTVGLPDPDLDVRILPENPAAGEKPLPNGDVGEVCIRHWTTLPGYLGNDTATSDAYTPGGHLRTGDLGRIRDDGMLELVGRTKDMYKSGGYNVYPREIELVIEGHPAVVACAVVPVPHPEYSEVGAAFVELDPAVTAADAIVDDIRRRCRNQLANYKVPKTFHLVDDIPVLANGKIDKVQLRQRAAALTQGARHE